MTAYLDNKPGRQTSAVQAVFQIRAGVDMLWKEGTVIDYVMDGKKGSFLVTADQGDSPVYIVFHDMPLAHHEFSATVTEPGQAPYALNEYDWDVVAP